jgi:dihydroorotate dehydrogenase subfamily 2
MNRTREEFDSLTPAERAQKLSRAGSPALGVELQISEQGEILARGNVIMEGYWDQPTATADAIRAVSDGPDATEWFHTGDGGIIDQENYLAISDRKKDVIISGGENVSSIEVEDAVSDYEASARLLAPFADYLAVNVSSPNTPGLRSLQSVEALKPILEAVLAQAKGKPVLVKIAPDLADEDVVAVAKLAKKLGLAGVIATNTTISRAGLKTASTKVEAMGAGGLSGAPVSARSIEVLRLLKKTLGDDLAVVSVGGVETKEQVLERMKAGATLVQGYTGFIYFGPLWARKLNRI